MSSVWPIRRPSLDRRGDSTEQFLQRQQPLGMDKLHQSELQMEALLLPVVQIVKGAQHDLQVRVISSSAKSSAVRAARARSSPEICSSSVCSPPSFAISALRR